MVSGTASAASAELCTPAAVATVPTLSATQQPEACELGVVKAGFISAGWSPRVMQAHFSGRTDDIKVPATQAEAAAVFWLHPTALLTACGIAVLLAVHLRSGVSVLDLPAAATGATIWALQEWFIHAKLLHSKWDWAGKRVHESHHRVPYYHITIDPVAHVAPAMAASLGLFTLVAGSSLGQAAALAYWGMGLLYVYAHYIVHTRALPSSDYWRRVRQHHMQHHCRNEEFWLSFCVPAVDSLMGTNPAAGAVPMTAMAKAAVSSRQKRAG